MSTTVNVAIEDVILISAVGVEHIASKRALLLEENIQRKMKETVWWNFLCRQAVFKYPTRSQAIEALKEEGKQDFWGLSTYTEITRYAYRNDEDRLKQLAKMAHSSIDGAIRLNSDDHYLLRKYAPALHKFVQDTTGLSH